MLPQTSISGAMAVAENLRNYFSKAKLKTSSTAQVLGNITISVGVARYRSGEKHENFINRPDQALYNAKNSGRNRVATESDLTHY